MNLRFLAHIKPSLNIGSWINTRRFSVHNNTRSRCTNYFIKDNQIDLSWPRKCLLAAYWAAALNACISVCVSPLHLDTCTMYIHLYTHGGACIPQLHVYPYTWLYGIYGSHHCGRRRVLRASCLSLSLGDSIWNDIRGMFTLSTNDVRAISRCNRM